MEEYREKTREELDCEKKIHDEQEKLIEDNADDLEFLHKKAEEIFYDNSYGDGDWDSLFSLTIWRIEGHHNPASLPVLLRLCDDVRFEMSVFKEGWTNVFAYGYEKEDLIREYFKNLHEVFPYAPEMGASIYCMNWSALELQKKYVLLAKPEALHQLCQAFLTKRYVPALLEGHYVPWIPHGIDELDIDIIRGNVRALKQYYDAHRLQVV